LAVRAPRFQLEHLTLLHHHRTSSIDDRIEESQPEDTRGDDHLSQREGVKPLQGVAGPSAKARPNFSRNYRWSSHREIACGRYLS
jgi:hypothetical protein